VCGTKKNAAVRHRLAVDGLRFADGSDLLGGVGRVGLLRAQTPLDLVDGRRLPVVLGLFLLHLGLPALALHEEARAAEAQEERVQQPLPGTARTAYLEGRAQNVLRRFREVAAQTVLQMT